MTTFRIRVVLEQHNPSTDRWNRTASTVVATTELPGEAAEVYKYVATEAKAVMDDFELEPSE